MPIVRPQKDSYSGEYPEIPSGKYLVEVKNISPDVNHFGEDIFKWKFKIKKNNQGVPENTVITGKTSRILSKKSKFGLWTCALGINVDYESNTDFNTDVLIGKVTIAQVTQKQLSESKLFSEVQELISNEVFNLIQSTEKKETQTVNIPSIPVPTVESSKVEKEVTNQVHNVLDDLSDFSNDDIPF